MTLEENAYLRGNPMLEFVLHSEYDDEWVCASYYIDACEWGRVTKKAFIITVYGSYLMEMHYNDEGNYIGAIHHSTR